MGKKGGNKDVLENLRGQIRGLHSRVIANDPGAIRVSAYLAKKGGLIAEKRGDGERDKDDIEGAERAYGVAEEMYNYGAKVLDRLRGDEYRVTSGQRNDLLEDAKRVTEERGLLRAGERTSVGVYTGSGEVRIKHRRYENATAMTLIWAMLGGAAFLMAPIITGNVVGAAAQRISAVFGLCLFVLGLIVGYVYLNRKK